MMNPLDYISAAAGKAVSVLYGVVPAPGLIQVQPTRKEFEGDVTLVVFPLLKTSHKAPEATAGEIGAWLQDNDIQRGEGFPQPQAGRELLVADTC